MPGTPLKLERFALLDQMGEDLFDLVEEGKGLEEIAVRLSDKCNQRISRRSIQQWVDKDETRIKRLADARVRAADYLAEQALADAGGLVHRVQIGIADKDDVAAAKLKQSVTEWVTAAWAPVKYGRQTNASVTVNVAALHLNALRQLAEPERPPELDVIDVEARPVALSDLL